MARSASRWRFSPRPVPDPIFEDRRLAEIYDAVDDDRSDLDATFTLMKELGARSVLDVGCGTGTFACMLAAGGTEVTAADPARASLAVARRKPGASLVRWVEAEASAVPPVGADVVTMTGNVAQVFLTDDGWALALGAAHDRAQCPAAPWCSRCGGRSAVRGRARRGRRRGDGSRSGAVPRWRPGPR